MKLSTLLLCYLGRMHKSASRGLVDELTRRQREARRLIDERRANYGHDYKIRAERVARAACLFKDARFVHHRHGPPSITAKG